MSKHYRHLQAEDRIILYELINQGCAIQDIANVIGCHKTTIYRELHRNSSELGYRPDMAHQQYRQRIYDKRISLLEKPSELKSFVIDKLRDHWSPELISGYLKRKAGRNIISHETIYRFIYSKAAKPLRLYQYLYKKRRFRYPRVKRRSRMVMEGRKRSSILGLVASTTGVDTVTGKATSSYLNILKRTYLHCENVKVVWS